MGEPSSARWRLIGPSRVGRATIIDSSAIIGHPAKDNLAESRSLLRSAGATVGDGCTLRSNSVVYERSTIGSHVQVAHNVVIREDVTVGDGSVFGNGTVVREGARLGKNVRLMESVVISERAVVGSDVFVGPNVSFTAGRHMTGALQASGQMSEEDAASQEGDYWKGPSVVVGCGVRIGANAVILAGVDLGDECVVAAGAVVSRNVAAGDLVAGNPARVLRRGGRKT